MDPTALERLNSQRSTNVLWQAQVGSRPLTARLCDATMPARCGLFGFNPAAASFFQRARRNIVEKSQRDWHTADTRTFYHPVSAPKNIPCRGTSRLNQS